MDLESRARPSGPPSELHMDSSGKSDNEGWSEFLFVSDTNSVGFEISETKIDERHLCKALHERPATLCASALVRSVLFS